MVGMEPPRSRPSRCRTWNGCWGERGDKKRKKEEEKGRGMKGRGGESGRKEEG